MESLQRLPYFLEEESESRKHLLEYFAGNRPFLDFIPQTGVDGASLLFPEVEEAVRTILEPGRCASLLVTTAIHRLLLLLFDQTHFGNTPISPETKAEQKLFSRIRDFMEKKKGFPSRQGIFPR